MLANRVRMGSSSYKGLKIHFEYSGYNYFSDAYISYRLDEGEWRDIRNQIDAVDTAEGKNIQFKVTATNNSVVTFFDVYIDGDMFYMNAMIDGEAYSDVYRVSESVTISLYMYRH